MSRTKTVRAIVATAVTLTVATGVVLLLQVQSSIEGLVPASPATTFRAYSIAEPITGAAVLRLHQDGRIDLDARSRRAAKKPTRSARSSWTPTTT